MFKNHKLWIAFGAIGGISLAAAAIVFGSGHLPSTRPAALPQLRSSSSGPAVPVATSASPSPSAAATTVAPASATETVRAYFADINTQDYAAAWAIGGKNLQGGNFDAFVAGFSNTADAEVLITGLSGQQVYTQLLVRNKTGPDQQFVGSYEVTAGVLTSAQMSEVSTTAPPTQQEIPAAPAPPASNPPANVPPAYDYVDCEALRELPYLADREEAARIRLADKQRMALQTSGLPDDNLDRRKALLDLSVAQKDLADTLANSADVHAKASKVTAAQC